jgi:hypothetical protein
MNNLPSLISLCFCLNVVNLSYAESPPRISDRGDMISATQSQPELSARTIIEKAYQAAGGHQFRHPKTLFLSGYNIIRHKDGSETLWDQYAMWREFAPDKPDAHVASGKVRIEAWTLDKNALFLAFDGVNTYNQHGLMNGVDANTMWANNFGFSAIRYALDEGWQQERQPDDLVDGLLAYIVKLTDPSGGSTLFGFRQSDFAIVYVGFNTAKGWHERRYSHFFQKPGETWVQAGRVRLFYNGIKANEAIWTDYEVGVSFDASLFEPSGPPSKPLW